MTERRDLAAGLDYDLIAHRGLKLPSPEQLAPSGARKRHLRMTAATYVTAR